MTTAGLLSHVAEAPDDAAYEMPHRGSNKKVKPVENKLAAKSTKPATQTNSTTKKHEKAVSQAASMNVPMNQSINQSNRQMSDQSESPKEITVPASEAKPVSTAIVNPGVEDLIMDIYEDENLDAYEYNSPQKVIDEKDLNPVVEESQEYSGTPSRNAMTEGISKKTSPAKTERFASGISHIKVDSLEAHPTMLSHYQENRKISKDIMSPV